MFNRGIAYSDGLQEKELCKSHLHGLWQPKVPPSPKMQCFLSPAGLVSHKTYVVADKSRSFLGGTFTDVRGRAK